MALERTSIEAAVARLIGRKTVDRPVEIVAEKFKIADAGVHGGFGCVYLVEPLDAAAYPKLLALKCVGRAPDYLSSEDERAAWRRDAVERLNREADFLETHSHEECLPRFYARGEMRDGNPFFVMERLHPMVDEGCYCGFPAGQDEAAKKKFLLDVLDSVQVIHDAGYVHGDIKPANIMRRPSDGRCVLVDFGTVHKIDNPDPASRSEVSRYHVATKGYDSPERGHTISKDVYAIGQVMRDLFFDEVPPLWAEVILKCVSRNPGYRYATIADVRAGLLDIERKGAEKLSHALSSAVSDNGSAWSVLRRKVYVSAAAEDGGDGSQGRPFRTIGAAVSAAEENSVIVVSPGEYEEVVRLDEKLLHLVSSDGPGKTLIRGERGKSVVTVTGKATGSCIRGFGITGGTGNPAKSSYGFDYYGGGINASVSVLVEDCVIFGNGHGVPKKDACTFGGAIFASQATVTLRNCRITDNFAWACGGGLMAAGNGAGYVVGECLIDGNRATEFFGCQGGIGLSDQAVLSISKSIVEKNDGNQIGGFGNVYCKGTRAKIERSYVEGGSAGVNNIGTLIFDSDNYSDRSVADNECGCRMESE